MVSSMKRYKVEGMATNKFARPSKNLPWAGKTVQPDQVEQELRSLWHLAADNMRISQNMNVRTSVLNFVIAALGTESARQASTLLRDLLSTQIARVTLVILDTDSESPSEVRTWVTLRSFHIISDVMRHPFEQITVTLSGDAVHSAANIIQSLLKPDLPVYLWWVDDLPTDVSIFSRLISSSSRVIVDSNDFTSPEERIQILSTILQANPACALSDLNWGRVTPWRELIAQFFDVADYRPYLVNVDFIEIEYAVLPQTEGDTNQTATSPNPIRALLLAAWLQTRLGWQQSDDDPLGTHDAQTGTYSWHMTKRHASAAISRPLIASQLGNAAIGIKESIDITIRPRLQAELHPGNICLVRLTSETNETPAVFTLDRSNDDDHVITSVQIPGSNRPQGTVNIAATHKENVMLSDELEIMGRDLLYEQTLHEVFSLLKQ
jgi:glucose-6-phosphate dehydrogenase assembly protein OpcA